MPVFPLHQTALLGWPREDPQNLHLHGHILVQIFLQDPINCAALQQILFQKLGQFHHRKHIQIPLLWAGDLEGTARHLSPICHPPGDGRIRLVSGADACQGRVEIFYQGSWGTVCDDDWGLSDASVVCKQVGCGQALEYKSNAYFGYGTGHILLDNVNCEGSEPILSACYSLGWGIHNCGHHEDAGVICMGNGAQGWDVLAQKQPAWPGQEGGSAARAGHATGIAYSLHCPALPLPTDYHLYC